jgi:hypothetical protein
VVVEVVAPPHEQADEYLTAPEHADAYVGTGALDTVKVRAFRPRPLAMGPMYDHDRNGRAHGLDLIPFRDGYGSDWRISED